MSLSQLFSLVDALQEPRNNVYDFGLGAHPRQLQTWTAAPGLLNPWQCAHPACPTSPANKMMSRRKRDMMTKQGTGDDSWRFPMSQVGKDGFQVSMDVTQFTPKELTVKVVDNHIVVEGKHEEREDDHGFISRHFIRRYTLPQGYEADKVMSSLSSDGVLTVNVQKPQALEDKSKERVVQIQQVGPAHLNVKQNYPIDDTKEKITNGTHHHTSTHHTTSK